MLTDHCPQVESRSRYFSRLQARCASVMAGICSAKARVLRRMRSRRVHVNDRPSTNSPPAWLIGNGSVPSKTSPKPISSFSSCHASSVYWTSLNASRARRSSALIAVDKFALHIIAFTMSHRPRTSSTCPPSEDGHIQDLHTLLNAMTLSDSTFDTLTWSARLVPNPSPYQDPHASNPRTPVLPAEQVSYLHPLLPPQQPIKPTCDLRPLDHLMVHQRLHTPRPKPCVLQQLCDLPPQSRHLYQSQRRFTHRKLVSNLRVSG
ncbi:uncharacterized protein EDB91DRAFT_1165856 [Suillus paluster]|uniref:uncharacterized protein n=1 Tax=Suillus paluster TaxID=48578 RepID=UPI001B865355|nr:uncharacterized protein EDB91DRAFT_1165856 [Suillus paluster]KAG1726724.1 hypothetical protein EDB91DRAFT_1165856 [Suillus paluster]